MSNKTFTSINNPEAAMLKSFDIDLEKGGVGSGKHKSIGSMVNQQRRDAEEKADDKKKKKETIKGDIHNDEHAETAHNLTNGSLGDDEEAEKRAEEYHSKENIKGGKDLVKQGWTAGDSFDWKEEDNADEYKHKMSKTHHIREVNLGDDSIHHLIKPKGKK